MENKFKTEALGYHKKGFSVIPLKPQSKIPMLTHWQQYSTTKSTVEEIEKWWTETPNANIGIVCGPAGGRFLFVVDQDVLKDENKIPVLYENGDFKERGDIQGCPPTVLQTSGSGGKQMFYFAPEEYEVGNRIGVRRLVDVKGLNGQVVVPPSIHPNGKEYSWDWEELDIANITEFPKEDLDAFLGVSGEGKDSVDKVLAGVPVGEGKRHIGIAQVAGYYLRKAKSPAEIDMARIAVYAWDKMVNKSPEPEKERQKEINNVFDGILKLEQIKRDKQTSTSGKAKKKFVEPKLWQISDILTTDFGEEEWAVENLISKQGITALSGNPGDFKTWLTIHTALCVVRNVPVFGKFKVTQGNVLIIDEEDHIRLLKKRLELLGAKESDEINYLSQGGIKVDNEDVLEFILRIIEDRDIKLVILDSLVRIHDQEENDASGMSTVFSNLQKFITAGASILFTHHHRKQTGFGSSNAGQSMRGSSDILAAVDCHIMIERKREEEHRLIIKQTKLRQAELLPAFELSVTQGEHGPSGFEYIGDYDERRNKAEEVAEAVVLLLSDGMKNRSELQEILIDEYGKTMIDDGIKIAQELEKIERVPREEISKADRKKAYYRVPGVTSAHIQNDLPVSLTYIDDGKQEDEYAYLAEHGERLNIDSRLSL